MRAAFAPRRWPPRGRAWTASLLVTGLVACAAPQQRAVVRASRALANQVASLGTTEGRASRRSPAEGEGEGAKRASEPAVARVAGDEVAVRRLSRVHPEARERVDLQALRSGNSRSGRAVRRGSPGHGEPGEGEPPSWSMALRRPEGARPEAVLELQPGRFVEVIWTDRGWRFAEDPTQPFASSTPRQAFAAFVRASKEGRWEVLLDLAPTRLRAGLSVEAIEAAWTKGDGAESLRKARDRLERALTGTLLEDADAAALEVSPGSFARAEREGDRWVVVEVP